ncbi:hypothetical protein DRE_00339 [Drechslerella stenobrocha 248]|uniref:PH domain-containing protein n=1 Tax=Drechslerella stenobrocha 248 TaxID=1043628 RepID=W7HTC9_9PEZI|nr:hypothetical protein DRE_00339 [Drechslerella stenobrocha 248]
MEGQTRTRYGRASRPKQLPKSFLDDDADDWNSRQQQHSAPLGGRHSRRGSAAAPKTAGASIPSTFLDDDDEDKADDGDDEKLWVQRSRGRHARGSESWRLSIDAGKSFFKDIGSSLMTGPSASGTTTPREDVEGNRSERRARSQSIARSRSRYRKAPPKIQTTAEYASSKPLTAPLSSHSHSASANKPSTAPPTKLTHEPVPLDLYRQYVTQLPPNRQTSAVDPTISDSFDSGPKTSGSDSTSSSSDGFVGSTSDPVSRFGAKVPYEPFDHNRQSKVMIVLSKKRQESYSFKHDTTVGDVLDWACKKETMTLRGAAILIERLPGFGFERALHELELVHTVIEAMGGSKEEATLYLDVDVVKSGNLRAKPGANNKTAPARLVANFYHAKGEDANVKIKSKRYFCLDDAKLTMSRMSSRAAKSQKSSHVCNTMDYGVYTVGQYGKKRRFDVPSKCQYIIILKALAQKQMFVDQSRFFHFLATDSQDQYFEWVRALHEWRSYVHYTRRRAKETEAQVVAQLGQEGVSSSADMTETKLARLLTETKLTQAKKPEGLTSPVLMSPAMISPRTVTSPLVSGAMNPPPYQTLSDKASQKASDKASQKASEAAGEEFLATGLLGAMYDKKVEIRNVINGMDMAPPKSSGGLERKGTLIQRAGNRREDAPTNLYSMPKTPKTPVRERSNGDERGRQGSRKDSELPFYRDETTSPPSRLQRLNSSHGASTAIGGGSGASPPGLMQTKPLLSFEAEEDEAFKHKKKITGHGVEVDRNAGPLINHATEPTYAHAITRSISTRMGKNTMVGQRARSATMRAASTTKKRFEVDPSFEPVYDPTLKTSSSRRRQPEQESGFETTGLLASLPTNNMEGHGVATGRHGASKPLMNMALNSNFVPGSLLEQHERVREGGPTYKKTVISREVC